MRLVSTIFYPKLSLGFLLLFLSCSAFSQNNSPYSRYALGDIVPSQNIVNRAMGGVSSVYHDGQSVNFTNPASYSNAYYVTYDLGITLDSRNLKSASAQDKFSSTNLAPSYFALGVPLHKKNKVPDFGMAFGLRSLSRVNYSIQDGTKFLGTDSIINLYQGDGGLNQAFVGFGKRWGNLSIGLNTGVNFGRKETSTRVFISDTSFNNYYSSNSSNTVSYSNLFLQGGLQYDLAVSKNSTLRFGVYGNTKQTLKAKQDTRRETFTYDNNGVPITIDSVSQKSDVKGDINMPSSYTVGVAYTTVKSMIGIEYQSTKWSDYKYYGQADKVIDNWQLRLGGSFTPNPLASTNFWSHVNYRAGVYVGKDHINADGKELKVSALTLGLGIPIRKWRSYDNQYTNINTTLEVGKRGNKDNNITEGFVRFSLGLNLSDIWFIKRKYE